MHTSMMTGTSSPNTGSHSAINYTNYNHNNHNNNHNNNTIRVANDILAAIEYCGIDRDGYTDRDPKTTSLCDVQLIGQVVGMVVIPDVVVKTNDRNDIHDDDDDDDDNNNNIDNNDNDDDVIVRQNTDSSTSSTTTTTTTTTTGIVLGCRFLLAARSVVLYRMLYGNYREAKTQSIALLQYPIIILQTIVYFCSYNTLNPLFPTTISHLELQLLLLQAADYLQLVDLCTLVTQTILMKHLSIYPERTVCTIYEHGVIPSHSYPSPTQMVSTTSRSSSSSSNCQSSSSCTIGSSTILESTSTALSSCMELLFTIAQQMIETRPYITLDPNNTYCHRIHRNNNCGSRNKSIQIGTNTNDMKQNDINCDESIDYGGGGITLLSVDKLQHLFSPTSKQNICASELFLLHQLLRWYQYHMYQLQLQLQNVVASSSDNENSNETCVRKSVSCYSMEIEQEMEIVTTTTKHIFESSLELSHIEPSYLLQFISQSTSNNNVSMNNDLIGKIITPERIYQAISQQALRASQCKSWSLPYMNGIRNIVMQQQQTQPNGSSTTTTTVTIPERVLIEGSGNHNVDGMYYRINTNNTSTTGSSGQSIRSSTGSSNSRSRRHQHRTVYNSSGSSINTSLVKNVLYTKREIMVGQQNVYTLSRCLRYRGKKILPQSQQQQINEAKGDDYDDAQEQLSDEMRAKFIIGSVGIDADGQSIDNGIIGDEVEEEEEDEAYYECRIFSSPFLTYRAVRKLQLMQIMSTIVPCYQPVMQLLAWSPPANSQNGGGSSSPPTINNNLNSNMSILFPTNVDQQNRSSTFGNNDIHNSISTTNTNTNLVVPTPIRKYYRIRLSDGEYHMPGTIAPELNGLIERKELDINRVMQILEFGVYTMYGCTSIHVQKAVVVTGSNTTPVHVFGNPSPLEEADPMDINNIPDDIQINSKSIGPSYGRLQNLYRAEVVVQENGDDPQVDYTTTILCSDTSCRNNATMASSSFYASGCIPKTGWKVDDHGIEPAPECTWIPPSTTTSSTSNTKNQMES